MRFAGWVSFLAVAGLTLSCDPGRPVTVLPPTVGSALGGGGSIPGAIFTTTPDGTIVNENVRYASKLEVYLDGGPGQNAPQKAASLPDGAYYFQVTDPSGKALLSEDPAMCRKVQVLNGVIVGLLNTGAQYPGGKGGKMIPCHVQYDLEDGVAGPAGHHDLNTDADHGDQGAKVVQLMPFLDTPNKGGVYKAWMIPDEYYEANMIAAGLTFDDTLMPVLLTGKDKKLGFAPDPGFGAPGLPGSRNHIKTDNFKAKGHPKCDSPLLTVRKFHDKDMDGVWDADEEEIFGWEMTITDPTPVTNTGYTGPDLVDMVAMPLGVWTVTEATPENTLQTAALLDGANLAVSPTVNVTFSSECQGEKHVVDFGNIATSDITVCKVYDEDADGVADAGETAIKGWKMVLSGGSLAAPIEQTTGDDGCTTFEDLLPGTYIVTEALAAAPWDHIGGASHEVTITSSVVGGVLVGSPATVKFANFCIGSAAFGTKGYWHNKNGLQEITDPDIAYVNGLAPYAAESSYFDAGDEPFDGQFTNGDPVAAAYSNLDGYLELIAGAGTARAEISHFLTDANASGASSDPREQLAQQLLAFIFNVRNRLDGLNTAFLLDGNWVVAGNLIQDAITAWTSGTAAEQNAMQTILVGLNESLAVFFVHLDPAKCPAPVF